MHDSTSWIVAALGLLALGCTKQQDGSETATAGVGNVVAEMENYRLTMADMRKYVESGKNLEQVGREHPELEPLTHIQMDQFDQLEAKIQGNPHLLKAVQNAGLSPHQYYIISWIVLNTTFAKLATESDAQAMLKQAHIHPANLSFFKEHEAELNALKGKP